MGRKRKPEPNLSPEHLAHAGGELDGSGEAGRTAARRCVDLGFGLANALEPEVVTGAMEKFQPELTVGTEGRSGVVSCYIIL